MRKALDSKDLKDHTLCPKVLYEHERCPSEGQEQRDRQYAKRLQAQAGLQGLCRSETENMGYSRGLGDSDFLSDSESEDKGDGRKTNESM